MWFFTDEEKQFQEECRHWAEKELGPKAADNDRRQEFNLEAFRKLGALGILGITADEDYGGAGLGGVAACLAMEEIGKVCASTALSYLAHSILCVNNINTNGSKEQKEKYLPKLISGEHIGMMGMSEADFGSDAIGMQTKAALKAEGYEITGSKMWITNAQYADICFLYARTGPGKKDLSSFIIEKDFDGFSIGKKIEKMGMRASPTGELIFEKMKAPVNSLVGKEGDSVYHMMKNLEIERITIAAISLGIAQACYEQSLKYAKERFQFGKPIGDFQLIQKMLAEMVSEIQLMRAGIYNTAKLYDLGQTERVDSAAIKLSVPKMATKIALDAIQLHGGYGYSQEFPLERYMRDAKLMEIGAGTNEVMISIIGRKLMNEGR